MRQLQRSCKSCRSLRTEAAQPQVGTRNVISVMSLPGPVSGSSATDPMQFHAFILAGRLPLTSAVFPKSNGCIRSDLRHLETFRAEPNPSGADDAFISNSGPTGSPPDHRAKYAREGKDPGAALDQRVVCVFTMINMVNEHKPRPPRNHSLATRWAGLKHSQTESSLR